MNTKLNKLYDRVLVVVESDALPIEVRTELFTADRAPGNWCGARLPSASKRR